MRRFMVLLAIGLCHMFLVSDCDILTLYAVCGLLLIPIAQRSIKLLVVLGVVAVSLTFAPLYGNLVPTSDAMPPQAAYATGTYSMGGFTQILALHWHKTRQFILPLLICTLPKTFGLMLLGIAAWRVGILKRPADYKRLLWAILPIVGRDASVL